MNNIARSGTKALALPVAVAARTRGGIHRNAAPIICERAQLANASVTQEFGDGFGLDLGRPRAQPRR